MRDIVVIFCSFRDHVPMLLVANKVDLVHIRKITDQMGQDLASDLKVCLLIPAAEAITTTIIRQILSYSSCSALSANLYLCVML